MPAKSRVTVSILFMVLNTVVGAHSSHSVESRPDSLSLSRGNMITGSATAEVGFETC